MRNPIHPFCITFVSMIALQLTARSLPESVEYIVENVNILSMRHEEVEPEKALAIQDGRIVAILDTLDANQIEANTRIDGGGRFLMPGLADMHVHVRWNPEQMFKLFLAHGVTTVANMRLADGEGSIDHLQLRASIATGELAGPRYLVSGHQLNADLPASIEAVEAVLDEHVCKGLDFVKIHGNLEPEVFDATLAGASERGLRVVGHAQHHLPLAKSLEMNALEHMEEFLYATLNPEANNVSNLDPLARYRANVDRLRDPSYRADLTRTVAESGIYLDPTLIVYQNLSQWVCDEALEALAKDPYMAYLPHRVKQRWLSAESNPYQEEEFPLTAEEIQQNLALLLQLTNQLHRQGVPLLLGTDSFGSMVPGHSLHAELALLVQAGLSPYEALRAGTVTVSEYLGESEFSGCIQEGYRADFILLDANPLIDIENAKTVSGVFTQGRWYSRSDIKSMLASVRQENTSPCNSADMAWTEIPCMH